MCFSLQSNLSSSFNAANFSSMYSNVTFSLSIFARAYLKSFLSSFWSFLIWSIYLYFSLKWWSTYFSSESNFSLFPFVAISVNFATLSLPSFKFLSTFLNLLTMNSDLRLFSAKITVITRLILPKHVSKVDVRFTRGKGILFHLSSLNWPFKNLSGIRKLGSDCIFLSMSDQSKMPYESISSLARSSALLTFPFG